jgi:hypothetical protein
MNVTTALPVRGFDDAGHHAHRRLAAPRPALRAPNALLPIRVDVSAGFHRNTRLPQDGHDLSAF